MDARSCARRSACGPTSTSSSVTSDQPGQLRQRLRRDWSARSSAPCSVRGLAPSSTSNAGMGFHSNDARGATIHVDPGQRRAGRPGDAARARARAPRSACARCASAGLQSTVAAVVPRPRLRTAVRRRRRHHRGRTAQPARRASSGPTTARLAAVADGRRAISSFSRARFRDDDPAGDYIPGALDRVISGGPDRGAARPLFGSLRVRHFGPRPLIEDDSVTVEGDDALERRSRLPRLAAGRVSCSKSSTCSTPRSSDIDYFYASRLPGEPAEGVEDIHTHPALPRTVRVGLQVGF